MIRDMLGEMNMRPLKQILDDHSISVPELFSIPQISHRLRSQIQRFVNFCKEDEDFYINLVAIGIKLPMHKNNNMREIGSVAAQILTYDNYHISSLFLHEKEMDKRQGWQKVEIKEEKPEDRLGLGSSNKYKYSYLSELFNYLKMPQIQQSCLSYFCKALKIILSHKPTPFFQCLRGNQQYMKLLLENSEYLTISEFLIAVVIDEESQKDQNNRKIKESILEHEIRRLQKEDSGTDNEGYPYFFSLSLQRIYYSKDANSEILKKYLIEYLLTKKRIQKYIEIFVDSISEQNVRVCGKWLKLFSDLIKTYNQIETSNQQQIDARKWLQPSIHTLCAFFETLLIKAQKIDRHLYSNLEIIMYYQLIEGVIKSRQQTSQISEEASVSILVHLVVWQNTLKKQSSPGLIQNSIFRIILRISPFIISSNSLKFIQQNPVRQVLYLTFSKPDPSLLLYYQKYSQKLGASKKPNSILGNSHELSLIRGICMTKMITLGLTPNIQGKQLEGKSGD